MFIRHLWQVKTVVFLHWCLIQADLLSPVGTTEKVYNLYKLVLKILSGTSSQKLFNYTMTKCLLFKNFMILKSLVTLLFQSNTYFVYLFRAALCRSLLELCSIADSLKKKFIFCNFQFSFRFLRN
jgi:hypothetical protein